VAKHDAGNGTIAVTDLTVVTPTLGGRHYGPDDESTDTGGSDSGGG